MTVALNDGEVVNSCDGTGGFSAGNIDSEDDFIEGAGAIGAKISAATTEFYTTTLGAAAPYDFSSGGGEEGFHIVIWFGSKTPLHATAGQRIVVGNGTDRGHWYVPLTGFAEPKTKIFVSRVVNTARDFDNIAAGTWTVGGNPAQLSNITQMGGVIQTITTIMGAFNNGQIDQFTIGTGLRVDGGTGGAPNSFETVRAQDEDTSKWAWWSSVVGSIVGKGKLYIGPASGSATSVFTSVGESVVFAAELVAVGFYELLARGAGTDVTLTNLNVSAEDASIARWSITIDSTTLTWADTGGAYTGFDVITLDSTTTITDKVFDAGNALIQNGATLAGCTFKNANTGDDEYLIDADDIGLISGSDFQFSDGHAIRVRPAGAGPHVYTFDGNDFTGYGADATNDASLLIDPVDPTADITINVQNAANPTAKSIYGYTGTLSIQQTKTLTVQVNDPDAAAVEGARVRIEVTAGGALISEGSTNASGTYTDGGYAYTSDVAVTTKVRLKGYKNFRTGGTITSNGLSVGVRFELDKIVDLP